MSRGRSRLCVDEAAVDRATDSPRPPARRAETGAGGELVDRSGFVNYSATRVSALIVADIAGSRITPLTNYAIETAASRTDGAHT